MCERSTANTAPKRNCRMVYCFIGHLNPASDRQQDGFKRLEELVTVAVQYIKRGAPDVGEGSFVHRLDKVDTRMELIRCVIPRARVFHTRWSCMSVILGAHLLPIVTPCPS